MPKAVGWEPHKGKLASRCISLRESMDPTRYYIILSLNLGLQSLFVVIIYWCSQVSHICRRFEFKAHEVAYFAISELEYVVFSEVSTLRGWYTWVPGCSNAYGQYSTLLVKYISFFFFVNI